MIDREAKIYIPGHKGLVGSAIVRKFLSEGFSNLVMFDSKSFDLRNQRKVEELFEAESPEYVIIAAAKVGGILANNMFRAEFIYDNLMIEANLIHNAYKHKVKKLIFLGSSCIYPKITPQPIKEEQLLAGYLEKTNEPYAVAKIAGVKLCENYFRQYDSNFYSVMPTNLYGPNDNFDLKSSHVLPALIRKIHEAKENNSDVIEVWGTGKPRREFLFVDDLADAIFYLFENIDARDIYSKNISHLNIGAGQDVPISELTELIKNIIDYKGNIRYDFTKPDGTPQKLLDVTRIRNLGWKHKTGLKEGIRKTYEWFVNNYKL